MDLDEIVKRAPRAQPVAWAVLETEGAPHLVAELAPDAVPGLGSAEGPEEGEIVWGWATDGHRAVAVVSIQGDPAVELTLIVSPADDRQRTQLASLGREGEAGLTLHLSRETLTSALELHDTDPAAAVRAEAALVLEPAASEALARIAFSGGYGAGP
jgi:hypothetical protein